MRQTILILYILMLASCSKDSNSTAINGLYTESTPVAGRTQLNFINDHVVVKTETGSMYRDSFTYSISTGKILLTTTSTNQYAVQYFDFDKTSDSTFTIQNLYPSIPENPKTYMTFKK